jgi:endonuclease/exonuclease/phosphatase (EEP) superfamily protein YafD
MNKLRVLGVILIISLISQSLWANPCRRILLRGGFPKDIRLPDDKETLIEHGFRPGAVLQSGAELRLLVWNIFKAEKPGFWRDLKGLGQSADVLLLQEGVLSEVAEAEFNSIEGIGWATALSFLSSNNHQTGVTSGFRYDIKEHCFVRSKGREPLISTPKMALMTRLPIENKDDLLVVNVHALNFVSAVSFAEQLKQIISVVEGHPGPLIVAGDFNTHMKARMRILRAFSERLGLEFVPLAGDRRRMALDHILVRGLKLRSARIMNHVQSSDHLPLFAHFEVL